MKSLTDINNYIFSKTYTYIFIAQNSIKKTCKSVKFHQSGKNSTTLNKVRQCAVKSECNSHKSICLSIKAGAFVECCMMYMFTHT